MKMAKASQADMEMALTLCSALEAVERRFFPEGTAGDDDPEAFDLHDDAHCGRVLRHLDRVLNGGSIGRVIWGMYVLLDPSNKLVHPAASTLEPHPDATANEADAQRLRWLLEDHQDASTRERCRALLERLPLMSYSAAVVAIDDAMKPAQPEGLAA
jgi:hypothetical protein